MLSTRSILVRTLAEDPIHGPMHVACLLPVCVPIFPFPVVPEGSICFLTCLVEWADLVYTEMGVCVV